MPMTKITLEIPEELAEQLNALPEPLPDLTREAIRARANRWQGLASGVGEGEPIYQELIDFLTADPDAMRVTAFKISPAAQQRLEDLLDRTGDDALTA